MIDTEKLEHPTVRGFHVHEAAKYLGVSQSTIYRMIRRNELSIRRISQRSIILRDDLDRLLGVPASTNSISA